MRQGNGSPNENDYYFLLLLEVFISPDYIQHVNHLVIRMSVLYKTVIMTFCQQHCGK